jgi:hypothetical protein
MSRLPQIQKVTKTPTQIFLDVTHKVGILGLFYLTGKGVVDFSMQLRGRKKQKEAWLELNPSWEDDPYLAYHPSWMRFQKAREEEVIRTRPQYYAAKRLRELEGLSFQPPYEYLPPDQRQGGLPDISQSEFENGDDYMVGVTNDPNEMKAQMAVFDAHKAAQNGNI